MVGTRTPSFDAPFRGLVMIWLALVGGVAAFGVVTWVLLDVVGMEFGVISSRTLRIAAPPLVLLMAAGLVGGRRLEAGIPRGQEPGRLFQSYQNARIVALSMCEGPGLALIVLSLLAGESFWALGGAAVCISTMIFARPRRGDLEALARRGSSGPSG